jgi:hypothetical protein
MEENLILESDREQLFHALLGDVSALAPDDVARKCLEDVAVRDLQAIEPIIETMLRRSKNLEVQR